MNRSDVVIAIREDFAQDFKITLGLIEYDADIVIENNENTLFIWNNCKWADHYDEMVAIYAQLEKMDTTKYFDEGIKITGPLWGMIIVGSENDIYKHGDPDHFGLYVNCSIHY